MTKKKFAIVGVGGYIAPKHLEAIKDNNGEIYMAHDLNDSVGILDRFNRKCKFYLDELEFIYNLQNVDYLVVCTPNYTHKGWIMQGLKSGCNVICEKPLVLNTKDLDDIVRIEKETGKTCNVILQLRHQVNIKKLVDYYKNTNGIETVDLKYITTRGQWYKKSWKGNKNLSGGLQTNIGIHFFDALVLIFGSCTEIKIDSYSEQTIKGSIKLQQADVNFLLSIDYDEIPELHEGKMSYRKLKIGQTSVDISEGFTELHTESYKHILEGNGFTSIDAKASIQITEMIRNQYHITNENS